VTREGGKGLEQSEKNKRQLERMIEDAKRDVLAGE